MTDFHTYNNYWTTTKTHGDSYPYEGEYTDSHTQQNTGGPAQPQSQFTTQEGDDTFHSTDISFFTYLQGLMGMGGNGDTNFMELMQGTTADIGQGQDINEKPNIETLDEAVVHILNTDIFDKMETGEGNGGTDDKASKDDLRAFIADSSNSEADIAAAEKVLDHMEEHGTKHINQNDMINMLSDESRQSMRDQSLAYAYDDDLFERMDSRNGGSEKADGKTSRGDIEAFLDHEDTTDDERKVARMILNQMVDEGRGHIRQNDLLAMLSEEGEAQYLGSYRDAEQYFIDPTAFEKIDTAQGSDADGKATEDDLMAFIESGEAQEYEIRYAQLLIAQMRTEGKDYVKINDDGIALEYRDNKKKGFIGAIENIAANTFDTLKTTAEGAVNMVEAVGKGYVLGSIDLVEGVFTGDGDKIMDGFGHYTTGIADSSAEFAHVIRTALENQGDSLGIVVGGTAKAILGDKAGGWVETGYNQVYNFGASMVTSLPDGVATFNSGMDRAVRGEGSIDSAFMDMGIGLAEVGLAVYGGSAAVAGMKAGLRLAKGAGGIVFSAGAKAGASAAAEGAEMGTKAAIREGTEAAFTKGTETTVKRVTRGATGEGADIAFGEGAEAAFKEGAGAATREGAEAATREGAEAAVKEGTEVGTKEGTGYAVSEGAEQGVEVGTKEGTGYVVSEGTEQGVGVGTKKGTGYTASSTTPPSSQINPWDDLMGFHTTGIGRTLQDISDFTYGLVLPIAYTTGTRGDLSSGFWSTKVTSYHQKLINDYYGAYENKYENQFNQDLNSWTQHYPGLDNVEYTMNENGEYVTNADQYTTAQFNQDLNSWTQYYHYPSTNHTQQANGGQQAYSAY